MGNYHPRTAAQRAVFEDVFSEMPLLDSEFDAVEADFSDPHQVELEVSGQFKSKSNH